MKLRTALLPIALLATSCGSELDPAWKVNSFRILAATIENLDRVETPAITDAAPGERVRLRLITADNADTPREVQVAWAFCAQAVRTGTSFGCAPEGASIAMGREVEYRVPTGITYSLDPSSRPRVQAVAIACTGTIGFDPATRLPTCTGAGAVGWTMTRSILVRLPADVEPSNRNPAIREVVLYRGGASGTDPVVLDPATPLRLPRCTAETCVQFTIEVRPADGSRERYETLNNQAQRVTTNERLVFGYYSTLGELDGTFRTDSAERPEGPIRNTLEAPRTAGTARLWFSAQDPRGGVDVVSRAVIFE